MAIPATLAVASGAAAVLGPASTATNVLYEIAESIEVYQGNTDIRNDLRCMIRAICKRYQHVPAAELEKEDLSTHQLVAHIAKARERIHKYDRYSRLHRYLCTSAIKRRFNESRTSIMQWDRILRQALAINGLEYETISNRGGVFTDGSDSPVQHL